MSGLFLCIILVFTALVACAVWLLAGGMEEASFHDGGMPLPDGEDD